MTDIADESGSVLGRVDGDKDRLPPAPYPNPSDYPEPKPRRAHDLDRMSDAAFHDAAMIAAMAAIIRKTNGAMIRRCEAVHGDKCTLTARGASDYADALLAARWPR